MPESSANNDFFVKFGSNAREWADGVHGELKGARDAIEIVNRLLGSLEQTSVRRRDAVTRNLAAMAIEADRVQKKLDSVSASGKNVGVDPGESQIRAAAQDLASYTSQLGQFMDRMSTLMDAIGRAGPEVKKAMAATNKSVGQTASGTTPGGANQGTRWRDPATGRLTAAGTPGAIPVQYGRQVAQQVVKEMRAAPPPAAVKLTDIPAGLVSEAAFDRIVKSVQDNVKATKKVETAVDKVARILNKGLRVEGGAKAAEKAAIKSTTGTDADSGPRLTKAQNKELYAGFREVLETTRKDQGAKAYDDLWRKLVTSQKGALAAGTSIVPGGGAEAAGAEVVAKSADRLGAKALDKLKNKLDETTRAVSQLESEMGDLSEGSSEYARKVQQLEALRKRQQSAEQAYVQQETRAETQARQRRAATRERQATAGDLIAPAQREYRERTLGQLELAANPEMLKASIGRGAGQMGVRELQEMADVLTGQGYTTPYRPVRPETGVTRSTIPELREAIIASGKEYVRQGKYTADDLSLKRVAPTSVIAPEVSARLNRVMRGFMDAAEAFTRPIGRHGLSPETAGQLIGLSMKSGGQDPRQMLDPRFITTSDIHDPGRTKGRLEVGAEIGEEHRSKVMEAAEIKRIFEQGVARAARSDVTEELRRNPTFDPVRDDAFSGIEGKGEEARAMRAAAAAEQRAVEEIDVFAKELHKLDDELKRAERAQRAVTKRLAAYEAAEKEAERKITKRGGDATGLGPTREESAKYTEDLGRLEGLNREVQQRREALQRQQSVFADGDTEFMLAPSYRKAVADRGQSRLGAEMATEIEMKPRIAREENRRALRQAVFEYFGRAKIFGTDQGNTKDYFSRALPGVRATGKRGKEALEFEFPEQFSGDAGAQKRVAAMSKGLNTYANNLDKLLNLTGKETEQELEKFRTKLVTGLARMLGAYQTQFPERGVPPIAPYLPPQLGIDTDFLERAASSIDPETGKVLDRLAMGEVQRQNKADAAQEAKGKRGIEMMAAYEDPAREGQFNKARAKALQTRIRELSEEYKNAKQEQREYDSALKVATRELRDSVKGRDKAEVGELSGEINRRSKANLKLDEDSSEYKDNEQAIQKARSRLEQIYTATPGIGEKRDARNIAQLDLDVAKQKAEEIKERRRQLQAQRRLVIGKPNEGDLQAIQENLTAQMKKAANTERVLDRETKNLAQTRRELAEYEARRAAEREHVQVVRHEGEGGWARNYEGPESELHGIAQEQLAELKQNLKKVEESGRHADLQGDNAGVDEAAEQARKLRGHISQLEGMVGMSDLPIENRQGYTKGAVSARIDKDEKALHDRLLRDEKKYDDEVRKATDSLRSQRVALDATQQALDELTRVYNSQDSRRGAKATGAVEGVPGATGGDVEATEKRLAEVTEQLAAARKTVTEDLRAPVTEGAKALLQPEGRLDYLPQALPERAPGAWGEKLKTMEAKQVDSLLKDIGSPLRHGSNTIKEIANEFETWQKGARRVGEVMPDAQGALRPSGATYYDVNDPRYGHGTSRPGESSLASHLNRLSSSEMGFQAGDKRLHAPVGIRAFLSHEGSGMIQAGGKSDAATLTDFFTKHLSKGMPQELHGELRQFVKAAGTFIAGEGSVHALGKGANDPKFDILRDLASKAPAVDQPLYRGLARAPRFDEQGNILGSTRDLASWSTQQKTAELYGKDHQLRMVGGQAISLGSMGGMDEFLAHGEYKLKRQYDDPSSPGRTIYEVEQVGQAAKDSAEDLGRLEREAKELSATLARLKAQAAGGGSGEPPTHGGGTAAAADDDGPGDKGILGKILLAIRQVNATLKGGLKVSGKVSAEEGAEGTAKKVVGGTRPERSTAQGRQDFEQSISETLPAIGDLLKGQNDVEAAAQMVSRGVMSETDALNLFRDKLKQTAEVAKDFRSKVAGRVGDLRLEKVAGAADDQKKIELANADDALHKEAIARNKAFDRAEQQTAQALKNEQREQRAAAAAALQHSAAMGKLSAETKKEIVDLAKMNAEVNQGTRSQADLAKQMGHVYGLMSRDLGAAGVGGATSTNQSAKRVFEGAGIDVGTGEVDEARKSARSLGHEIDKSAAAGATNIFGEQSALTKAMFGSTSFWSRVMASTGTFVVRNFAAGFVFGITAALQQVIAQAILTESTFIRVSDALAQTGRETGGLRSDLQSVSSDYGVALNDVYMTAAGLVGVFDSVGDIASATRVVAQLQAISMGALNAQEAMGVLASITGAYGEELRSGQAGLEQVADTLTVVQNVIGTNVETTAEGVGALSGLAQQLKIPFAEMSVYVAQIAKLTNQTGAAAGEQFSRILAAMQGGRGRAALTQALPDSGIESALSAGDYGAAIKELLKNWDGLSESQQRNLAVSVAGQRQARSFAALMANSSKTLEATARAHNANGEAQKRADAIAHTLNGQLQRLMSNFQNLAQNLVRTGLLNFFGVLLQVANGVLSVTNKVFSAMNDLADSNPFLSALKNWGAGLLGLIITLSLVGKAIRGFKATMAASGVTSMLVGGGGGDGSEKRPGGLRSSMMAAGPMMYGKAMSRADDAEARAAASTSRMRTGLLHAEASAARGAARASGVLGRGLGALAGAGFGAQLAIVGILAALTAAYSEWKARREYGETVRGIAEKYEPTGYLPPWEEDKEEYVGPSKEAVQQEAKRRSGFVSTVFDPNSYRAIAELPGALVTGNFDGVADALADHLGISLSEEWQKEMAGLDKKISESFKHYDHGLSALKTADPDLAALLLPDSGKGSIRARLAKVKPTSAGVQRLSDDLGGEISEMRQQVATDLKEGDLGEDEANAILAHIENQAVLVNDQIAALMLVARGLEEIDTLSMDQIKNIDQIRPLLQTIQGVGAKGLTSGIQDLIKGTGVSDQSKAGKIMAQLGKGTMTHMEAMQKDYKLVRQEYTNLEAKYYAQIQGTGPSMDSEDFDALEADFIAKTTELAEKTDKLIQGFVEESTTIAQAAAAAGDYAGAAAALDAGLAEVAAHRNRKTEGKDVRARRDLIASQAAQQMAEYAAQGQNAGLQVSQAYSMNSETDANLEAQITRNLYNAMVNAGAPADAIRAAKIAWINAENAAAQAAQATNIAGMAAQVASLWNGIAIARGQEGIALQQYNDAVANAGANSAEALNALASLRNSQHATLTTMDQVAQAHREAVLAGIPQGNAVAVSRQTVANARAALGAARKYGQNSVEYQGALAQLYQAQQQARLATQAVAQAQIQVSVALADAAGHTIRSAVLQLRAARLTLAQARKNAGGAMSAEALQAKAGVISSERALKDAKLQDSLDTIDFNVEMGRMTQSAAISALQQILRTADLTKAQRRDLMLKIKGMKDELAGDGMWNFGDISMPKPYQMRRYIEEQRKANQQSVDDAIIRQGTDIRHANDIGGRGRATYNDHRNVQININGGDEARVRRIVREVVGKPGRTRTTQHRRR